MGSMQCNKCTQHSQHMLNDSRARCAIMTMCGVIQVLDVGTLMGSLGF